MGSKQTLTAYMILQAIQRGEYNAALPQRLYNEIFETVLKKKSEKILFLIPAEKKGHAATAWILSDKRLYIGTDFGPCGLETVELTPSEIISVSETYEKESACINVKTGQREYSIIPFGPAPGTYTESIRRLRDGELSSNMKMECLPYRRVLRRWDSDSQHPIKVNESTQLLLDMIDVLLPAPLNARNLFQFTGYVGASASNDSNEIGRALVNLLHTSE